ncbi:helix-turn-helix DNA binding domain protein [Microbacterium phage Jefe]|uniref:RNA polymerase sigma factor n=9 Tax=Caudoviricetes TaxID=2731619 RepID=A0A2U8UPJ7_9CAUD|nr:RNA polymerase sigma factor [Microbacterium phage Paschalis]YP_009803285.1 RNA polymerase sigma factor [Microbacterium phage Quhwah]YP_009807106.1 RNA polymerase sigma factor [Microbacterium phage KaiHaiDragon]QCW22641.1 RNA polymerase sigma factor [Microbacterium phage Piperis]QDF19096.1 RNA polymerase sigma factor [Microbacterium phage Busephilis]QGH76620.1 RNA polymerase sigma factor [Microbacterium phage Antares]QOC58106.1 RNA polymerase sigma factor [Microbacterium phage Scumberland]
MTITTPTVPEPVLEVGRAFEKRRQIAQRLADQDRYIGAAVRTARKAGHSWAEMARAAKVSDVAILKAARRPEKETAA